MPEDNNVEFKLITRRWIAWGTVFPTMLTLCFLAIWGAVSGAIELVTLSVGVIGTMVGGIVGYFFGKKTSEE